MSHNLSDMGRGWPFVRTERVPQLPVCSFCQRVIRPGEKYFVAGLLPEAPTTSDNDTLLDTFCADVDRRCVELALVLMQESEYFTGPNPTPAQPPESPKATTDVKLTA